MADRSRMIELRAWRPSGWAIAAGLVVLTLISLYLRTRALHMYYWVDEGISVGIASHPLGQLPGLLREDGSPPLYYALLHVWMQWFGRTPAATHVLSLIFALATIPAAYWTGTSLFDRRAGFICAVLAAGLPFLTAYGQETRMYSLLVLLSLVAAASFSQVFLRRDRRYLPAFSLALAAALYTHNWALFLALACGLGWLGCVAAGPDRRALARDGVFAFGAVLVLYAPWMPTLLYQAKHTGAPWALPPAFWSLTQGGYFIVGGRGAAVALLLAGGAGLAGPTLIGGRERTPRLTAIALLALGVGTVLIAWIYAKTTPAWAFRYLAVIVGPLLLAFGAGLSRAGRLGLAALALICCYWVLAPLSVKLDAKSNVGSAAAKVHARAQRDAVVLSTQPEEVPALAYYFPHARQFVTPLGRVSDPGVMDWRNALARFRSGGVTSIPAAVLADLRPGERVDLVAPVRIATAPEWMRLIQRSSTYWERELALDRKLRLLRSVSPDQYSTGWPVHIWVYVRRSG